jgi:hypothetical protein
MPRDLHPEVSEDVVGIPHTVYPKAHLHRMRTSGLLRRNLSKGRKITMEEIMEYLPFLIPLVIVQFALFGYALWHILTHTHYKRGTRTLWLLITIIMMNYVGPILYLVFGKEDL